MPATTNLLGQSSTLGRGQRIERDVMQSGDFGAVLQDLLAEPIVKRPVRAGIEDAVTVLTQLL